MSCFCPTYTDDNYEARQDHSIISEMQGAYLRIHNLINLDDERLDDGGPGEGEPEDGGPGEGEPEEEAPLFSDEEESVSDHESVGLAKDTQQQKVDSRKNQSQKSKKGRAANSWNYSLQDVNVLLDIVEEHEPIGMNGWARVYRDYNKYAQENDRPRRRSEALKKKYDKLCYMKKQTGDPTCPDHVRRAKNIQNEILSKMVSVTYNSNLGDKGAPEEDQIVRHNNAENGTEREVAAGQQQHTCTGKRHLQRPFVSPAKRRESMLYESMREMSKSITELAQVQLRRERRQTVMENDIESLVETVLGRGEKRIQSVVSSTISKTMEQYLKNSRN